MINVKTQKLYTMTAKCEGCGRVDTKTALQSFQDTQQGQIMHEEFERLGWDFTTKPDFCPECVRKDGA